MTACLGRRRRVPNTAVRALNRLTSVVPSYLTIVSNPPHPSCPPPPQYISYAGVCFSACPSACLGHLHQISSTGILFLLYHFHDKVKHSLLLVFTKLITSLLFIVFQTSSLLNFEILAPSAYSFFFFFPLWLLVSGVVFC